MRKIYKIANIAVIFTLILNTILPCISHADSSNLRPPLAFDKKENHGQEQADKIIESIMDELDKPLKTINEYEAEIKYLLNIENEEISSQLRGYFIRLDDGRDIVRFVRSSFIDEDFTSDIFTYFYYQLAALLNTDASRLSNVNRMLYNYSDMDERKELASEVVQEVIFNIIQAKFEEDSIEDVLEDYIWSPCENPEEKDIKSRHLKELLESDNKKLKKIVYKYLDNLYRLHGEIVKWFAKRTGESNESGLNFDEYIKSSFPVGVDEEIYRNYITEKGLTPIDVQTKLGYARYYALRGGRYDRWGNIFKEVLSETKNSPEGVSLVRDELSWMMEHGMHDAVRNITSELDNAYIKDCMMLKEYSFIISMFFDDFEINVRNEMRKRLPEAVSKDFAMEENHFTTNSFLNDAIESLNSVKKFLKNKMPVAYLYAKLSDKNFVDINIKNYLGLVNHRASKEGADKWVEVMLNRNSQESDDWSTGEYIRMSKELGDYMLKHPEDLEYYKECMAGYLSRLKILYKRLKEIVEYFRNRALVSGELDLGAKIENIAPPIGL
jgi:hypothetical protein